MFIQEIYGLHITNIAPQKTVPFVAMGIYLNLVIWDPPSWVAMPVISMCFVDSSNISPQKRYENPALQNHRRFAVHKDFFKSDLRIGTQEGIPS